jgi:hypothetical protein
VLAPSDVKPYTVPEVAPKFDMSPNQSVAETKQLAKTSGYPEDDNEWIEQSSLEGSESRIFYLHKSTHHPLAPMEEVSAIVEQQRISKQVEEKPELCLDVDDIDRQDSEDSEDERIASSLHTSPLHGVHRPSFDIVDNMNVPVFSEIHGD